MKLVFIYGPPATGKLTVAKHLAKLTGFKLFHNHMTFDLVGSIFEFGTKPFAKLNDIYRLELFEAAAKEDINGLIFTFVYAKPDDDHFIKETIRRVERHGGKVYFVQLLCDRNALFRRVKHASRENFDKIKSRKSLHRCLGRWELFSKVPFKRSLSIDNTKLPPRKAAQKIKAYFKLRD
jgi:hypothetical protein